MDPSDPSVPTMDGLFVGGVGVGWALGVSPPEGEAARPFIESRTPDLILEPGLAPPDAARVFRWGALEVSAADGLEERFWHGRARPGGEVALRVDFDLGRGQLFRAGPAPWRFGHPLDRFVFARLLAAKGRAIVHAAGIVAGGVGALCGGVSGAGKTTLARAAAARGLEVLSDEHVVVGLDDHGEPRIWGTPWSGEGGFARAVAAPLGALLLLEQAPTNELVPLSSAAAAARVLALSTLPYWNPAALARAVEGLSLMVEVTPAAVLRSRGDASSVDLLAGLLLAGPLRAGPYARGPSAWDDGSHET